MERRDFIRLAAVSVAGLLFISGTHASGDQVDRPEGISTPLASEPETLAKRIECKLIAPCCFAQTVANHYSNVAENLKQQIRQMLAQGATEEQILNTYVRIYGERILAEPQARGFNLLAYLLPPLALASGLAGLLLVLSHKKNVALDGPVRVPVTSFSINISQLRARLAEELSRFEC